MNHDSSKLNKAQFVDLFDKLLNFINFYNFLSSVYSLASKVRKGMAHCGYSSSVTICRCLELFWGSSAQLDVILWKMKEARNNRDKNLFDYTSIRNSFPQLHLASIRVGRVLLLGGLVHSLAVVHHLIIVGAGSVHHVESSMDLIIGVHPVILLFSVWKDNKPSSEGVLEEPTAEILSIHWATHPGVAYSTAAVHSRISEGDSKAGGEYQGEEELHRWMAVSSGRGHYILSSRIYSTSAVNKEEKEWARVL